MLFSIIFFVLGYLTCKHKLIAKLMDYISEEIQKEEAGVDDSDI